VQKRAMEMWTEDAALSIHASIRVPVLVLDGIAKFECQVAQLSDISMAAHETVQNVLLVSGSPFGPLAYKNRSILGCESFWVASAFRCGWFCAMARGDRKPFVG
jgi:hypothetical protein